MAILVAFTILCADCPFPGGFSFEFPVVGRALLRTRSCMEHLEYVRHVTVTVVRFMLTVQSVPLVIGGDTVLCFFHPQTFSCTSGSSDSGTPSSYTLRTKWLRAAHTVRSRHSLASSSFNFMHLRERHSGHRLESVRIQDTTPIGQSTAPSTLVGATLLATCSTPSAGLESRSSRPEPPTPSAHVSSTRAIHELLTVFSPCLIPGCICFLYALVCKLSIRLIENVPNQTESLWNLKSSTSRKSTAFWSTCVHKSNASSLVAECVQRSRCGQKLSMYCTA